MLSYKEYLKEEYVTSAKDRNITHEIYVNPTSKEFKSIEGGSYSIIIDLPNKDVYVFSRLLLHEDAINALHREGVLKQFNYYKYWKEGFDSDKYLTMNIDGNNYYSDSLSDMVSRQIKDKKEEVISKVKNF